MTCRYVGLMAWAGVAAALALGVRTSEPRQTGDFAAVDSPGRRQLQQTAPSRCFKTDNCRHMSWANAVDHCDTLGGHLCSADELQTYTLNGEDEDECGSEFAERDVWAASAPRGLVCGAGEQAFRVPSRDPPCDGSCTSAHNDCCAPWDEPATCQGSGMAVPVGWCGEDPEGQYMCCDPASPSSFSCAADTAEKPVVCCKEKPYRLGPDGWACENLEGWACACPEKEEREDFGGEIVASLLLPLICSIGPLFISCCCCSHFRNKSLGTAPFNGGAVKSFPRAAAQPMLQPVAQTIQLQVPKGSGPGTQLSASANGVPFNVVVPAGVAEGQMFQVAVPVTPAQPVQATLVNPVEPQATGQGATMAGFGGNPAAAGVNSSLGENTLLAQMAGMEIKQQVNVVELVSGCEAKNRYHVHNWDPNHPHLPGQFCMLAREESDGFERICCKQNRHLVLYVHEGQAEHDAVIMQIHKSFGLAMLPCCRPSVMIFDGQGNKIGSVDDPWHCCVMDQRIYDLNGNQIFGAAGSVCQAGIFCPCLGTVEFDITDAAGNPTQAHISKVFDGCAEIMAKVNRFRVTFPQNATAVQKMALLGCTMLIDFEYFEQKG